MDFPVLFMLISGIVVFFFIGAAILFATCYHKVPQGMALVRTGAGGTKISFTGTFVFPVLHQKEMMDISVKSFEISREGKNGLVCKDNLRADIRVAFFIRVSRNEVKNVAQSIGCKRASDVDLLRTLFEAKFSEALKTVGKQFDFVDLYNSRDELNKKVVEAIGTNLNGYVLDDCAIDYLEQTSLSALDADNILDSEGIKKITELTASQKMKANQIRNDEIKTIKKQDVERQEAVLELEKQQAEAEEKQKREVSIIKAREEASSTQVQEEERMKAEQARIRVDEELEIAEQNKARQVIIAQKNKEKVDAVESERVEKDRLLEVNEREKIVELARIDKEKSLEVERREIQDVIKERVIVEKTVVEEEEKIKDTKAFAEAERTKSVALTQAEQEAEEAVLKQLKAVEAEKVAAEIKAKQKLVDADAAFKVAEKEAEATKVTADAMVVEAAADGLAEAKVMESKAQAKELQAEADAKMIEMTSIAEAKGMEAKASAIEQQGMAEAKVLQEKALVEAERIRAEAEANKMLDEAGRDLEEFRLKLSMQKEIELAKISIQKEVAMAQAQVMAEALKASKIDIVGGETMFFEKIVQSIANGKSIDGLVNNSQVLTEVKQDLLQPEGSNMIARVKGLIQQFGLNTEDVKNLSVAALLTKLSNLSESEETKSMLGQLLEKAQGLGITEMPLKSLGLNI